MKNKEALECHSKTGHLPNKKIVCTSCTAHITMFGSNLENRIKKFGSLPNLLETFKCRNCVSASKPKKIVIKAKKIEKKPVEEIVYEVPKMKFSIPRNVLLSEAPDIIESVSKNGSCIRPDIYLNNDRSCDGCSLYNNCLASIKNLKRSKVS